MISLRSKVRWWAIYSRGFVIILQLLSNLAIPDHDPSGTFTWITVNPKPKRGELQGETLLDQFISLFFDGLVRWDAHHFLHIANNGYTYENNLAFFPLYPLMVKSLANFISWFIGDFHLISYVSLLKICAVYINFIAFVLAADIFYSLSRRVLREERLAYKASLLFCLNPASIFFTAPYSETVFALFSFSFMLILEKTGISLWSGIFLALSSTTRVSGLCNIGFVIYKSMKIVATQTILYVRAKKKKKPKGSTESQNVDPMSVMMKISSEALFPGIFNIFLGLGSFVAFQWYCLNTFCHMSEDEISLPDAVKEEGNASGYIMPGSKKRPQWCINDPPVSYNWVLSHYWNAGFLYNWYSSQLPQFIIAGPIIGLCLLQLLFFIQEHPRYVSRGGLVDNTMLGLTKPKENLPTVSLSLPRTCLVYILHATFLAIFALLFMHVQITTRLICSSSPVPYWFAAILITSTKSEMVPVEPSNSEEKSRQVWLKVEKAVNLETRHATILLQDKGDSEQSNWIKIYFLGYTLLGTVLFSNNYPWI